MTMIEKYRDYLRYEKNYSSHTEISYYTDLLQFQSFLEVKYPELVLSDVDRDVIRDWIVSLVGVGLSSASVNRKLSAIKSYYRFLQKMAVVSKNPVADIKAPQLKKSIPSFVNHSDMKQILDGDNVNCQTFQQMRDKVIIELFYITGIRRAELIQLKDDQVDLERKVIRVVGKRNKERLVPLSSKSCDLLRLYLVARKAEVEGESNSFFVTKKGDSLYPMLVYRIVHSALSWIPTLRKSSPHILRHSFATNMLNNRASINSVKEILGHESLASTEIYTHTSLEELKKIYNQAHPRA